MKQLTTRQREILAFIRETIERDQCPPTNRMIAQRFGFVSLNAVSGHVDRLIRKGFVERRGKGVCANLRLLGVRVVIEDLPDAA